MRERSRSKSALTVSYAIALGSGLSDIDMGLRLRYELSRKLAPYMGVAYQRTFAGTSGFTREDGGHVNDLRFLVGLRAWF